MVPRLKMRFEIGRQDITVSANVEDEYVLVHVTRDDLAMTQIRLDQNTARALGNALLAGAAKCKVEE